MDEFDEYDDSPQAHAGAALGAEILVDAMTVNGCRTMGELMARPDARRLVAEARERVLAPGYARAAVVEQLAAEARP